MKIDYVGSMNRPRINFSSGRVIDYKGLPFDVTEDDYATIKENPDFVLAEKELKAKKEVFEAISPVKAAKKPKRKTAKKREV